MTEHPRCRADRPWQGEYVVTARNSTTFLVGHALLPRPSLRLPTVRARTPDSPSSSTPLCPSPSLVATSCSSTHTKANPALGRVQPSKTYGDPRRRLRRLY